MPISTAEFSKRAVIFIALALTPLLIWTLFDVVLLLTGAVLIAVLLHVVAWPLRKIRLPKAFALAIAGLLILAVIAGVFYLFGSGMGEELQEILRRAEAGQKQIIKLLQGSTFGKMLLSHVQEGTFSLPDLLERAFRISASFLAGVVIAIVIGAFVAADPALYRQGLSLLFPRSYRKGADETIVDLAGALRLWTLGQLMEMTLVGVTVGVAVWLVGLPSPYALGAIACVAQFVPYIGPIIAMIPSVLVATTVSWTALAWTIAAYLAHPPTRRLCGHADHPAALGVRAARAHVVEHRRAWRSVRRDGDGLRRADHRVALRAGDEALCARHLARGGRRAGRG